MTERSTSPTPRVLVAAYFKSRDKRTMGAHQTCSCGDCKRVPLVIVGARSARRYLCGSHANAWATRHGYSGVDTI